MIERRSGAGRAYREGTLLFTVGEGKAGAAYVHGDQGRATPSLKEVGFLETVRSVFVKEKIGALGLADVDSYGNADSTQDEDSALNNAAMSRKSWQAISLNERKKHVRVALVARGGGQPAKEGQ